GGGGRGEGSRNLAGDMAGLAEARNDQLAAGVQDQAAGIFELLPKRIRKRVQCPRLVVDQFLAELNHVAAAAVSSTWPAISTGSLAEMTCAATRSPMTFSVVRHMSRKRSTPSTNAIA